MRFLLLNQYYPPDLAPTGRYLHDVARTLAARGHEVLVVCSKGGYASEHRSSSRERLDGVHVRRLPALTLGRSNRVARVADYASFLGLLFWTAFRLPRPNLVLALTTPPYLGLAAKIVSGLRSAEHAHWIMDLYPDAAVAHGLIRPQGALARSLGRLSHRQFAGARLVLSIGPFMAERVHRYLNAGQSCKWVPLWTPPGLTLSASGADVRAARGWAPDETVLMYSGNMGLGHRFGEFLEAASRLGSNGPRWAFFGDGVRRHEIESYAFSHPETRISLHPYEPDQQLAESLAAADVHLISLADAWQGVIVPSKIQAIFAVGRPVIFVGGRDNEIGRWIEEAGAGWIVAESDVDGLITAVRAAASPEERLRRGGRARAFAENRFGRQTNRGLVADLVEEAAQPETIDRRNAES